MVLVDVLSNLLKGVRVFSVKTVDVKPGIHFKLAIAGYWLYIGCGQNDFARWRYYLQVAVSENVNEASSSVS